MTDHYEALGAPRGASSEEILAAYRRRAQATHPDRQGGSDQAFIPVVRAYEVLSDPERRARYDSTGDDDTLEEHVNKRAMEEIIGVIKLAVEQLDVNHEDIIAMVRLSIDDGERQYLQAKRKGETHLRKMEAALRRLKKRNPSADFIGTFLRESIEVQRAALQKMDIDAAVIAKMRELLQEYDYQWEPILASQRMFINFGNTAA